MNDDQIGVLERERRRREAWAERGVPDPIDVLAAERTTRRLYGPARDVASPGPPREHPTLCCGI